MLPTKTSAPGISSTSTVTPVFTTPVSVTGYWEYVHTLWVRLEISTGGIMASCGQCSEPRSV